jgi:hypothetical protein
MKNNMVDGLGFDQKLKQYYTITYAWCHVVPDKKQTGSFDFKTGITKSSVDDVMKESVLTRGKGYIQESLWEEKKYLPKGTSLEDANSTVLKMDMFFKDSMYEKNYQLRKILKTKDVGTEFVRLPINGWKKILIEEWNNAFEYALLFLNKNQNVKTDTVKKRGSQNEVLKKIGNFLKKYNKVYNNIVGGYGKTLLQYFNFEWSICKNIKIKVFYHPNISLAKQMAIKHAQYDEGTYREGLVKRIVISSDGTYIKNQKEYNIDNKSASNKSLEHIIELYMLNGEEVNFYVVNKSAKPFRKMFNKIKNKLSYNKKTIGFIDEMDSMTGHIGNDTNDAVVNSITDYLVSFTATLSLRNNKDKNKSIIYNDDEKYFGKICVIVTPHQAVNEGVNCPYEFKITEVSDQHPLFDLINDNGIIDVVYKDIPKLTRGNIIRSIVTLIKSIKEDKKTHCMLIISMINDCEKFYELLKLLIEKKYIPKKYTPYLALNGDESTLKKYDNDKFAIVVGSPWLTRGMDTLNTDALIFGYGSKSVRRGAQGSLRAVRIGYEGKKSIIYIVTNPNAKKIPPLLTVANFFREDVNPYQVADGDTIIDNNEEVIGSPKKKLIEISEDRDTTVEPMQRFYLEEVYSLFKSRILGNVDCKVKSKEMNVKYCDEIFSQYKGKYRRQIQHEQPKALSYAERNKIIDVLIKKYEIQLEKIDWNDDLAKFFIEKHKPNTISDLSNFKMGSGLGSWLRKNNKILDFFPDTTQKITFSEKIKKEYIKTILSTDENGKRKYNIISDLQRTKPEGLRIYNFFEKFGLIDELQIYLPTQRKQKGYWTIKKNILAEALKVDENGERVYKEAQDLRAVPSAWKNANAMKILYTECKFPIITFQERQLRNPNRKLYTPKSALKMAKKFKGKQDCCRKESTLWKYLKETKDENGNFLIDVAFKDLRNPKNKKIS